MLLFIDDFLDLWYINTREDENMDKNYYEILEIDKNASPEIVEKAYKTLVKKYHPDLQEVSQKQFYEDKLKLINEAYEILSIPEKRKEYDLSLPKDIPPISTEDYEALYNENRSLKNKIEQAREENVRRQHSPSINYYKEESFDDKTKRIFNNFIRNIIALLLTILILFLIFQIPFVKQYFIDLYNDNSLIRGLVDTILNIF